MAKTSFKFVLNNKVSELSDIKDLMEISLLSFLTYLCDTDIKKNIIKFPNESLPLENELN